MTPLTAEKIAELERLLAAATVGPWQAKDPCLWDEIVGDIDGPDDGQYHCTDVAQAFGRADAALIVAMHEALPYFLSLAKRAAGAPVCNWSQEDDESDCWVTSCGNAFSLNDGTPSDNSLKHCCYCGRHLTETRWEPDEDALVEIVGGEEGCPIKPPV
jgi:hypothetical protein